MTSSTHDQFRAALPALVEKVEKIVPNVSFLYKKTSGLRLQVNRMQENIDPENPAEGVVATLWNGQTFFEYATNDLNLKTLESSVLALAKQAAAQVSASPKTELPTGPNLQKVFSNSVKSDPDKLSLKEKLAIAKKPVDEALKKDSAVQNVISVLSHRRSEDLFVNRTNVISQALIRSDMMLMVFVSNGKKTTEVYDGVSKNGGFDTLALEPNVIERLIDDGKKLLSAERLKPGVYDVIADPDWAGIIAHECFGHGMETDLYVRDRAMSQRYLGKQIASPIVNMFDDPSLLDEAGGFYFDDEGQLSTPTHIIKNGMLMRGLTDMPSANKLHMTRSANGRRESFERKAYARMTNTFFDNGTSTREEMIASVQDGLYLRYATNGMEDPQAWGIQVEGLWAEEIKKGKLTGVVYSPVIMTGFVPDLLKSISMVGNDRWISGLGMCGKGHKEWVKNTTGGPHLKLKARLA